jgi:hypothetical protein
MASLMTLAAADLAEASLPDLSCHLKELVERLGLSQLDSGLVSNPSIGHKGCTA